jgi:HEAT repeat protein
LGKEVVGRYLDRSPGPNAVTEAQRRQKRRAALLIPALNDLTNDPDLVCRRNAVRALRQYSANATTGTVKASLRQRLLAMLDDRDESVRAQAAGSLATLADGDLITIMRALRSATADPSTNVRQAAAWELGNVGWLVPKAQTEAASILIPLMVGQDEPTVRMQAASALALFGNDRKRFPPQAGPDVVPALLAALRDQNVEVRRRAASILGQSTFNGRSRSVSSWSLRKAAIVPALKLAMSDVDRVVQDESALALFALGDRDPLVIEGIERAANDSAQAKTSRFRSALEQWRNDEEEPDGTEVGTPGTQALETPRSQLQ